MQDGLDAIKIASGDLNFDPLLDVAARSGKPVILSTGMARMEEIRHAVDVFATGIADGAAPADRLAVLHCVSLYPTPPDQANLAAIPRLARELGVTVGYSDHTLGIDQAVLSLALGARIVEKHFTLDKARSSFRDHALSADPAEFARLAQVVHAFDSMLGTGEADGERADAAARSVVRRSIVASRALPAGSVLEDGDLDFVRPANGLPPSEAKRLVGRRLARPLARHQAVQRSDFE
jgi:N-acetylneuraminate synthase/N,N'-diacetyllegionaminate synthase